MFVAFRAYLSELFFYNFWEKQWRKNVTLLDKN